MTTTPSACKRIMRRNSYARYNHAKHKMGTIAIAMVFLGSLLVLLAGFILGVALPLSEVADLPVYTISPLAIGLAPIALAALFYSISRLLLLVRPDATIETFIGRPSY